MNEDIRGAGLDDNTWTAAAGYNFGFLRPSAVYEHTKYETPTGDLKRDLWGVGLTVPMGGGTWYAFYGHAGDGKGSAATGTRVGGLAKGSDTSSNQWELSYTYALSKRSLLYAGYVKLDNKCNAHTRSTSTRTPSVVPSTVASASPRAGSLAWFTSSNKSAVQFGRHV